MAKPNQAEVHQVFLDMQQLCDFRKETFVPLRPTHWEQPGEGASRCPDDVFQEKPPLGCRGASPSPVGRISPGC